jgi:hypothetical protein
VSESTIKGAIAEAAIAAAAIELGIFVLRPLVEGRRYDLMFDTGDQLLRGAMQVGGAERGGDRGATRTSRHTPHGYVRSTYSAAEIDAIAVYCQGLKRCYLLPIDEVAGRFVVHLRLAPAANNQEVASRHGMAEAGGSSPPSSTSNVRPLR